MEQCRAARWGEGELIRPRCEEAGAREMLILGSWGSGCCCCCCLPLPATVAIGAGWGAARKSSLTHTGELYGLLVAGRPAYAMRQHQQCSTLSQSVLARGNEATDDRSLSLTCSIDPPLVWLNAFRSHRRFGCLSVWVGGRIDRYRQG